MGRLVIAFVVAAFVVGCGGSQIQPPEYHSASFDHEMTPDGNHVFELSVWGSWYGFDLGQVATYTVGTGTLVLCLHSPSLPPPEYSMCFDIPIVVEGPVPDSIPPPEDVATETDISLP